jgi:hypothetical protein
MLTFRDEQLHAFRGQQRAEYIEWVSGHLGRCFPELKQQASELEIRDMVSRGIGKAESYGITDRRNVCRVIDLMAVFGPDFDTDERFPGAATILADQTRYPATRLAAVERYLIGGSD